MCWSLNIFLTTTVFFFLLKYFLYVKIDSNIINISTSQGQMSLQPMLPSNGPLISFSFEFVSILGNKTLIIRPLDLLVVENLIGGIK